MRQLTLLLLLGLLAPSATPAQDQPQQEPAQKVGPGVHAPVPLLTPEAEFPDAARQARKEGICMIWLVVDAKGYPQNARIVRCTDPVFAKNSMDAVMKYRFKPATRAADGAPVPVQISVEVNFRFSTGPPTHSFPESEPPTQIRYAFFSPPKMTSLGPDADGVYPLSKELEIPVMKEFVSEGFGKAAIAFPDGVGCHLLLKLNEKGKPTDAQVLDCDRPSLKWPAIDSLMKSKYKPARRNGVAVPVRMTVHLIYDGFGPHKQATASAAAHSSQP